MIIPSNKKPKKGEISVWTVSTGVVNILKKQSREAAKYITSLDGFVAVTPILPRGMLWLFDTKEHAHIGKAKMEEKGIHTGDNICEAFVRKEDLK